MRYHTYITSVCRDHRMDYTYILYMHMTLIPSGCPGFFLFQLAINIDMNGKIYGTLVQFGCYQHRYE